MIPAGPCGWLDGSVQKASPREHRTPVRLVKRTVNFDDPSACDLYYGDETGTPGTLVMFFAWPDAGCLVSPVRDRNYFRSVYYRERNGILFEVATDVPGFTHDESVASLGSGLKLLAQWEPFRAGIESALPSLPRANASRAPAGEHGPGSGETVTGAGSTRS